MENIDIDTEKITALKNILASAATVSDLLIEFNSDPDFVEALKIRYNEIHKNDE